MVALYGGCRCQTFRYELASVSLPLTYACHCLDCQTMSGSAFALQMIIPQSRFSPAGELIEWAHPNRRSTTTRQQFCATCKTRIYSTSDERVGILTLRAGTLDESASLKPIAHMWVKRKQPWFQISTDAETYDEGIPADRMKILFASNFS
jgi:hypothetical protein